MELIGILGLIIAGLVIATAVMAIGIGGGILWTPLLILGYGLSPSDAVTLSLLIQVIGMGSGAVAYLRAGLAAPRLALILFAVAAPGVVLGSVFSVHLPQAYVQFALGVMAMTVALLFVSTQEELERPLGVGVFDRARLPGILPVPAFFGLMMGFLSTGIGEWIIPLLKGRLRMEMRRAIATVVPVMFLLALTAASLRSWMSHDILWEYVLWGGLGTLVGGQIGPQLNKRVAERLLKEAFIYLMTLVGIHLIFQAV